MGCGSHLLVQLCRCAASATSASYEPGPVTLSTCTLKSGELAAWEAAGSWRLWRRRARAAEAVAGRPVGCRAATRALRRHGGRAWGLSCGAAKGVGTLGMLAHARDRAVAEARQAEVHGARLAEHTVGGVWCGEWCVVW